MTKINTETLLYIVVPIAIGSILLTPIYSGFITNIDQKIDHAYLKFQYATNSTLQNSLTCEEINSKISSADVLSWWAQDKKEDFKEIKNILENLYKQRGCN